MSIHEKSDEGWCKEKEELKMKFILIANKYSLFKGSEQSDVSEKLRLRFAKTKEEFYKMISAL